MSHPRAVYPLEIAEHYRQHGGKATARAYRTNWTTLRRWLVEHGVEIRPWGLRLGQTLRSRVASTGVVGFSTASCPPIQKIA